MTALFKSNYFTTIFTAVGDIFEFTLSIYTPPAGFS
jgi:hypothetical protein